MEEAQAEKSKEKVNVKRLLITIAIVLVTALVVGGVTWYYMDKNAKDLKEANDKEIQALEKQITILKKAETTGNNNTAASNQTQPSVPPATVVNNFLTSYLEYLNSNNNGQGAAGYVGTHASAPITSTFKTSVTTGLKYADPIILAQNTPDPNNAFTVGTVTVAGNSANVPVTLNFIESPSHIVYGLVVDGNEWKINSVKSAN